MILLIHNQENCYRDTLLHIFEESGSDSDITLDLNPLIQTETLGVTVGLGNTLMRLCSSLVAWVLDAEESCVCLAAQIERRQ